MAALGSKKYRWPLAVIYFKPTTWLKPCSDFGPRMRRNGKRILLKLLFNVHWNTL